MPAKRAHIFRLLMANVGRQYATAVGDLSRLLTSVNRSFQQGTDDGRYATYDASRLLRDANCGSETPSGRN